ncbi:hypothetical protein H9Y04_08740 [Streptomyces sp. TRM66268-LWL]|uniref:PE-PGRS family protein n=1 Tax=Streptomyces polyasparticus TaxID=2767826 RepID=A0ABR7SD43_9ACTN|nr:hypothetical protein [Streptomyces polyasparticus]MBC9712660.1 hypothetical protein [Streptomyces polyasparticus]
MDEVGAELGERVSADVAKAWLTGLGSNPAAPAEVLVRLLDTRHTRFLWHRDVPEAVLDAAVVYPSKWAWGAAAESGRLSAAQWERLLAHTVGLPEHALLVEMAQTPSVPGWPGPRIGIEPPPHEGAQPPATPKEIAAWADAVPDIPPGDRTYALWWIAALHDRPEAMRQLVASSNLRIRRSIARARRLPPDVVDVLATCEDKVVHLFLAESCDDAPPELLLDVWTWWSGSLSFPGRPRNHPNFPRDGLLRFADDPRPRVRLLALDDSESPASLVERFTHDTDPDVRRRAAEDPRLQPASAARLADDSEWRVRRCAHRNPVLPRAVLVRLLQDEASAEDAAQNPGIPVPAMHRMIATAVRHERPPRKR